MIGYGASGAGKTSTLVYFKSPSMDERKDGILIEICKKLKKDANFNIAKSESKGILSK